MASSALQKLMRNRSQSAAKIITRFRNNPENPQSPLLTLIPKISKSIDEPHLPNHFSTEYCLPNLSNSHVYPSFSFGFFLNPMAQTSLVRSEIDDLTTPDDDPQMIRADSVKKKRKKKMNKHKLRKLRKRLRRKT